MEKLQISGFWNTQERAKSGGWFSAFSGDTEWRGMNVHLYIGEDTAVVTINELPVEAIVYSAPCGVSLHKAWNGIDRRHYGRVEIEVPSDITEGHISMWKRQREAEKAAAIEIGRAIANLPEWSAVRKAGEDAIAASLRVRESKLV